MGEEGCTPGKWRALPEAGCSRRGWRQRSQTRLQEELGLHSPAGAAKPLEVQEGVEDSPMADRSGRLVTQGCTLTLGRLGSPNSLNLFWTPSVSWIGESRPRPFTAEQKLSTRE